MSRLLIKNILFVGINCCKLSPKSPAKYAESHLQILKHKIQRDSSGDVSVTVLLWPSGCFEFSLLSPSPAPSRWVCIWACQWAWQQQQGGTPESDQLITSWLYNPGLSTTSAPDCYVLYGDYTMPLVFPRHSQYFMFQCFWPLC